MNLSEEEVVNRLLELQQIDEISDLYVKHLYLYDLIPLMNFRPSVWNNGILLSFIDSNWETMEYDCKIDVDQIFMERLIEIIPNQSALSWYNTEPMKFINEVAAYVNETNKWTLITIEERMTDFQAEAMKQNLLRQYLIDVSNCFHILTDGVFTKYTLTKLLFYGNDASETIPEHSLHIKNINISAKEDRLVANMFVYEMIRKDLC